MQWSPLIVDIVTRDETTPGLSNLLEHLDESTESGSTPLHFAALQPNPEVLSILLNAGANANALNYYHESPLHWAVKAGNAEIVSLLLEAGARPDSLDGDDKSPVDWAIQEGQTQLLPLLGAPNSPILRRRFRFISLRISRSLPLITRRASRSRPI
jgi:ankyrin repeat protein